MERAFLILIDMSLLISFVPYIYLFFCLLSHGRKRNRGTQLLVPGGPIGAVVISMAGLSTTLFAMSLALVPPAGTANLWLYETKVGGGSLLLVLIGLAIYWRAKNDHTSIPR